MPHITMLETNDLTVALKGLIPNLAEGEQTVLALKVATATMQAMLTPIPDQFDYAQSLSLTDAAKLYSDLKSLAEEYDDVKKSLNNAVTLLSEVILPELMDEAGFDTVKVSGVGRIQLTSDIRCNVLAANREDLKEWLRKHGHASMISDTVNSSSLKAFIKEMIKEEKEWPKDCVKVHEFTKASVVKA